MNFDKQYFYCYSFKIFSGLQDCDFSFGLQLFRNVFIIFQTHVIFFIGFSFFPLWPRVVHTLYLISVYGPADGHFLSVFCGQPKKKKKKCILQLLNMQCLLLCDNSSYLLAMLIKSSVSFLSFYLLILLVSERRML